MTDEKANRRIIIGDLTEQERDTLEGYLDFYNSRDYGINYFTFNPAGNFYKIEVNFGVEEKPTEGRKQIVEGLLERIKNIAVDF